MPDLAILPPLEPEVPAEPPLASELPDCRIWSLKACLNPWHRPLRAGTSKVFSSRRAACSQSRSTTGPWRGVVSGMLFALDGSWANVEVIDASWSRVRFERVRLTGANLSGLYWTA